MMSRYLVIDVVALVVYLITTNPGLTGVPVHEWLGVGIVVVFCVHVALHVDRIIEVVRGSKESTLKLRGNLVLDALIVVVCMVVSVSGMGISGSVLPTFGLFADGYYFWNPLHSIGAKMLLALLVIHVVMHGKWLYRCFRKDKGDIDG